MNTDDFWHLMLLAIGVAVTIYAFTARQFRRYRLFTSGDPFNFKPKWYDRAWLAAFGLYFTIISIIYFVKK